jgi:spore maturation protein SpmA
MTLNPTVFDALEGLLQMISDSIFSAKDTAEKPMFYLLSTVYTWDDIIKEAKPSE